MGCTSSKASYLDISRLKLDQSWHGMYTSKRIALQNKWILTKLNGFQPVEKPRLLFTAGAMGSGKTHSLRKLADFIHLDLQNTLIIDPDKFKDIIPEFENLKKNNPENASTLVHKESALLSELTLECALQMKLNTVVDGSLNDWKWYRTEFQRIRKMYPIYETIELFLVRADWQTVLDRANKRGTETGRIINENVLEETYQKIPTAISELEKLVDVVYEVDNNVEPYIQVVRCNVK